MRWKDHCAIHMRRAPWRPHLPTSRSSKVPVSTANPSRLIVPRLHQAVRELLAESVLLIRGFTARPTQGPLGGGEGGSASSRRRKL